jgi:DNA-binding SARP family transcriptional activator
VALARRDRSQAKQLIEEARQLTLTPIDSAHLDMLEGVLALRSRAHTRAVELLGRAAERLESLNRPHFAARAYLLRAEAFLASGVVSRAEESLNRLSTLVVPLNCEGFLRPTARMTRQVLAERNLLRKLRRETRLLLERIASSLPLLSVVASPDADDGKPQILQISPFGQGKIVLASRQIDSSALPPRAREVLFYAARQQRVIPRAELIEVIWEDDQRASQSLWDASRHIRRVLGERNWSIRAGKYSLNLTIQDDGLRFESYATTALGNGSDLDRLSSAERALELTEVGGYLEWCDSMWASAQRARVVQLSISVALVLAELYDKLHRPDDAIAACRRAIVIDQLDEAPRRAVIRYLSNKGEMKAAIQEYREYKALLQEELATEPSVELRKYVANLGR